MRSRKLHALSACVVFFCVAQAYALLTQWSVEGWRVLVWSALGVGLYILLCSAFGFDPQRTRVARFASPIVRYVERWELRLGQATLALLGCVVVAARFADPDHFVMAVVCGTLSAWTYFALRLYAGGYRPAQDQ